MEEKQNTGLLGGLFGQSNLNVSAGLPNEQFVYLGFAIMIAMTLGFLFGGVLKQKLGLT